MNILAKVTGVVLIASLESFASESDIRNVTECVRAAEAASYGVSGGIAMSDYPLSRVFDGDLTGRGRYVCQVSGAQPVVTFEYTINDAFEPGKDIVAESIRYYRSGYTYDYSRTASRIRLEGSTDGTNWQLLVDTFESLPIVDNSRGADITDLDELAYDIEIPRDRQGPYRRYRFTLSGMKDYLALLELVIEGRILDPALVWTGSSAGGTWNSSSATWSQGGITTSWKSGGRAEIGASQLTVAGTQSVGEVVLTGSESVHIAEGALSFSDPGRLVFALDGTVIDSDVSGITRTEDTLSSCAQGQRNTDYTKLPRVAGNSKTGEAVIWWTDRRLPEICGFTTATMTGTGKTKNPVFTTNFENDGEHASVWFAQYKGKNDTLQTYAWLSVKVEFQQVGQDISARIVKGGYSWLSTEIWGVDGSRIDFEAASRELTVQDLDDDGHSGYVGLQDILAVSGREPKLEVDCAAPTYAIFNGFLPQNSADKMTGLPVPYFSGVRLNEIERIRWAAFRWNQKELVGVPTNVVNTAESMTVQFQALAETGLIVCVKVEFRQDENGITARAVYARYLRGNNDLGVDFDPLSSNQTHVYDGDVTGYSVRDILVDWKPRKVSLAGDFEWKNSVTLRARARLSLDGNHVVLPHTVTGEGVLSFEPSTDSAQRIVVADSTKIGHVVFAGRSELTFGAESSLEIGIAELGPGAQVFLPDPLDPKAFRIGESACLSRSDLRKFVAPKGFRVLQDKDGYIGYEQRPPLYIQIY